MADMVKLFSLLVFPPAYLLIFHYTGFSVSSHTKSGAPRVVELEKITVRTTTNPADSLHVHALRPPPVPGGETYTRYSWVSLRTVPTGGFWFSFHLLIKPAPLSPFLVDGAANTMSGLCPSLQTVARTKLH